MHHDALLTRLSTDRFFDFDVVTSTGEDTGYRLSKLPVGNHTYSLETTTKAVDVDGIPVTGSVDAILEVVADLRSL